MSDSNKADLLELTTRIVSAHLGNNQVAAEALPSLIKSIHGTLVEVGSLDDKTVLPVPALPVPAMPWRQSVAGDFIVCLEDGKKLKTLRRHLMAHYNLTPSEYRAKWNLPPDYPMVAPNYAILRSRLAKEFGLGRRQAGLAEAGRVEAARDPPLDSGPNPATPVRILLVDDAVDVLVTVGAFLKKAGFDVTPAESGDHALALLASDGQFDALITDYAMPGMNGVDLIKQAREVKPGLPALMITGFAAVSGIDFPKALAILRKPFQRRELIDAVRRATGQAALQDRVGLPE